jgi:hypothetical protein
MSAAVPTSNRGPRHNPHPPPLRDEPPHAAWRTAAQIVALALFLAALGATLLLARSPASVASSPAPPSDAPRAGPPPSTFVPTVYREHLIVQIVSDHALWQSLRARPTDDQLVRPYVASPSPVTFEFLYIPADENLDSLLAGLAHFEALCVLETCPTIHLIDLRTAPPTTSWTAPTLPWPPATQ